jgi:hypothetical protein
MHDIDVAIASGLSIGITDIDNKIKEAEYNALNYFNKACPYCGNGVFDGHIRNKLNLDHFWPISKGGQNVPWNILPICGRCNRKKKDKLPYEFLEPSTLETCMKYLSKVRDRYCNESQKCCEMIAKIKSSILNDPTITAAAAMKKLLEIFEMNIDLKTSTIFDNDYTSEWIISGDWKNHLAGNQVEKSKVYEVYLTHCKSNNLFPDSVGAFGKKFFKLVKCKSVRINYPGSGIRPWGYRLI